MASLSRSFFHASTLLIALALAACSDDSGTSGGTPDTTPPAVTSVTPVDQYHLDVAFNEDLGRESAEDTYNYIIIEQTVVLSPASPRDWPEAPGDTLQVLAASLNSDQSTVSLTTEAMGSVPYDLSVAGVADASGNAMSGGSSTSFTGTTDPDVTAPEIVYRSPAPGATNAGIGQPVVVQFSEPVNYTSFATTLLWESNSGEEVPSQVTTEDAVRFTVSPLGPLEYHTLYHVTLSAVEDIAGNAMSSTTWSYTTTSVVDVTPPRLVSSVPVNLATNVNVDTNISLTFSEAVNQTVFNVQLSPDPGDGVPTWSNGGRTLTFDPDLPLADDQQYNLTIFPDGVRDLAGNGFADVVVIQFTTGNALASGSLAGTLSGDPNSNYANDPTGATVVASTSSPFAGDDFIVGGADVVAGNNGYDIGHLRDDVYYPIAVMDSNGDGAIDPSTGDAIGAFGIDIGTQDFEADSVIISGGNRETGVNFPLFDPSAITGTVQYEGGYDWNVYNVLVGLFDTSGFDPTDPPVLATEANWPERDWNFETLDGLVDGDYYVGAFLDVNSNFQYDPATEPAGLYGGNSPTVVHVENGSDVLDLVITMQDPVTALEKQAVRIQWPAPVNRAPWLEKLSAIVREQAASAAETQGRAGGH
jgi:Bacterial Ig-like domain